MSYVMLHVVSTRVFLTVAHIPCGTDICHVMQMNGIPGSAWPGYATLYDKGILSERLRAFKYKNSWILPQNEIHISLGFLWRMLKGTIEIPDNVSNLCIENIFVLFMQRWNTI